MMATPKASSSDTRAPSSRAWPRVTPTDEAATFLADAAACSESHSVTLAPASVVSWLSSVVQAGPLADTSVVAVGRRRRRRRP